MRLLIYSDLHLDLTHFCPQIADGSPVDANVDIVILAGDIHAGTQGLCWARETFPDKGIIYVSGNHEFYGGYWTRTLGEMSEAARTYDVNFLEADELNAGGVRFLGVTLWTNFQFVNSPERDAGIKCAIATVNDCRSIKVSPTSESNHINESYLSPN